MKLSMYLKEFKIKWQIRKYLRQNRVCGLVLSHSSTCSTKAVIKPNPNVFWHDLQVFLDELGSQNNIKITYISYKSGIGGWLEIQAEKERK